MNPARAGVAHGARATITDQHTLLIDVTKCFGLVQGFVQTLKFGFPFVQRDESKISCRSLFTVFAF